MRRNSFSASAIADSRGWIRFTIGCDDKYEYPSRSDRAASRNRWSFIHT